MDFSLNEQHEKIREKARKFSEEELRPIAADIDRTKEFPTATVKRMGELGFMGMVVSPDFGGQGLDAISYVIAVEEVSRVCASHGVTMSVNNSLACFPIDKYGTDDQKGKYLTPLASGQKLGCFGLTEAGAGTDAGSQSSTAVKEDDEYILNGSKIFITNGSKADTVVTFAMTDKSQGVKGISAFVFNTDTQGFSIGGLEKTMGIRGSDQAELVFEDMRLPADNLLGNEGDGFKIALSTLDGGRIGIAAQALGISQAALEETARYAKETIKGGRPIAKSQNVQWILADMATNIDAARLLVYKAAHAKDTQKRYSTEAAMAKLYASDVAVRVTRDAVQVQEADGYRKGSLVERLYRDSKITEIYEGTSEVQRMVIAGDKLR